MKRLLLLIALIFLGIILFYPQSLAQNSRLEIYFYYSPTCPHCIAEKKFLNELEEKYSEIKINRYLMRELNSQELLKLKNLLKKYKAEKYFGVVPLTFVGEDFFLGFDNAKGIGKEIEDSLQRQISKLPKPLNQNKNKNKINLPIIGKIDTSKYSLPVLTVILGILDGFNVCSLGALILILGLVLVFRSRKKILLLGGLFLLTTAIVYGFLIIFWYQLFSLLVQYQKLMAILIGGLGIGGGAYFLKEFIKFKRRGAACESKNKGIVLKFSSKIKDSFKNSKSIIAIAMSILVFAALITIVEFPCSAAVPLMYAGILSHANLSGALYFLYISFYLVFYLFDEILVFLIALFTLKLWLSSPKFVIWITLAEAIILFLLGFYYLIGF